MELIIAAIFIIIAFGIGYYIGENYDKVKEKLKQIKEIF